ncbi:MAG: hypothetical protein MI919_31300, partial [Holophagales bacterium]|nr:hypothetical protein [Holophagales bacterium]
MRVINLSGRPFVNRRPVYRLAALLWVAGVLLLMANLWLYLDHMRDSSESQGQINAFRRQVVDEQARLDLYWNDLRALDLGQRNQQASYLNELIHRRTFPWSALFDDLERVLPIDVYLASVQPALEGDRDRRARSARQTTSRRAVTPAEAR